MARWGIESGIIDPSLPYAAAVQQAADECNFPAKFIYAIAWRESINEYGTSAAGRTSDNGDGGFGLCQLTEPWAPGIEWPPPEWDDACTNAKLAIVHYLDIDDNIGYWVEQGYSGTDLVRLAAATFNAGLGNARDGHADGNVDEFTTNNYGSGVLAIYNTLVAYGRPT